MTTPGSRRPWVGLGSHSDAAVSVVAVVAVAWLSWSWMVRTSEWVGGQGGKVERRVGHRVQQQPRGEVVAVLGRQVDGDGEQRRRCQAQHDPPSPEPEPEPMPASTVTLLVVASVATGHARS
jgi:hypothetical protein